MKTPEQIRDMEFQSAPMGGYKKGDVDLFLEEVASEIEILMKQKLEADRKLQEISKKTPEAALSSAGIQNVLISAQRVAEQITDDARNQAQTIVAEANLKLTEAGIKAQEIISDAEKNASLLGRTAETEAAKIIAEAVAKSEETVAAAKESVELQQKLYDRLKIEVSDYKKKAVTQCAAVLELMNQLPDEIPFNMERAKTVLAIDFNDPVALLNNAVEERVAKERAEAEAAKAAEAAEIKAKEDKAAADAAARAVEEKPAEVEEPSAEPAPISIDAGMPVIVEAAEEKVEPPAAISEDEEYQLTFEEAEIEAEPISAEAAGEEVPIKKGKISFGDDDDDDDDEEEGFFFKRKKK